MLRICPALLRGEQPDICVIGSCGIAAVEIADAVAVALENAGEATGVTRSSTNARKACLRGADTG